MLQELTVGLTRHWLCRPQECRLSKTTSSPRRPPLNPDYTTTSTPVPRSPDRAQKELSTREGPREDRNTWRASTSRLRPTRSRRCFKVSRGRGDHGGSGGRQPAAEHVGRQAQPGEVPERHWSEDSSGWLISHRCRGLST
jgi:hypothetical protein